MKKVLLFFLFIGITFFSEAQLTVSGFSNIPSTVYDTPPNTFYTLTDPPAPTFPNPFIADAGTNVYKRDPNNFGGGGIFVTNVIIRINDYWYIGQQISVSVPSGYAHTKTLSARTKVIRNTINPPCFDIWETVNYNQSTGVSTPSGIFLIGTLSGNTCVDVQNPQRISTTILPNLIDLPQLTPSEIQAIPTPIAGSIVYDLGNLCMRLYDGSDWRLIKPNGGPVVFSASVTKKITEIYAPTFTLTDQHHHIYSAYNSTCVITLPPASTCVGREYVITNFGIGNVTVTQNVKVGNNSIPFVTTFLPNTSYQIISNGSIWIKVN